MVVESAQLLANWFDGDEVAATEIFDRYVDRLVALARKRLSDKLKPRVDPEDIVQSAYRSFFRRAGEGAFTLERNGDLWRLLAGITVKKLLKRVEKEQAQKNDPDREVGGSRFRDIVSKEPDVDTDLDLIEQLKEFMEELTPRDREILELRFQDEDIPTIARKVERAEATVRRVLRDAKNELKRRFAE